LLLNKFFRLSIHDLVAKIQPDKVMRWCADGDFLRPVFPASRVQHISLSDMHSKFALRPHHVSKYGRHPGYIFVTKAHIDNRKKFVKQQYVLHTRLQYGELRPTNS